MTRDRLETIRNVVLAWGVGHMALALFGLWGFVGAEVALCVLMLAPTFADGEPAARQAGEDKETI
jgi:hypothetical protein